MSEKISIRPSTITINKGKVLLVKSKYDQEEFYLFPGGGIEFGETLEQTAIRETLEETGAEIKIIKPIYINEYIDFNDKSKRVVNIFFLSELKKQSSIVTDDNGKIKKVEWVLLSNLKNLNLKPRIIKERLIKDFESDFDRVSYSVDYKNGK